MASDLSREEMMEAMLGGIKTPKERGRAFRDLSKRGDRCRSLYVVEEETNPRDFMAPPKIYGAYWSDGPDAVNAMAISLWPQYGSPAARDDEDNVDGSRTRPGECYMGSACLGFGQKFLALSVRRVESAAGLRRFNLALARKVLASRGLSTEGGIDELIERADAAGIIDSEAPACEGGGGAVVASASSACGAGATAQPAGGAGGAKHGPTESGASSSPCVKKSRLVAGAAEAGHRHGDRKPKKKPGTVFVLETVASDDDDDSTASEHCTTEHATSKEAARAAWEFCERHDLNPLGDGWYTDTGRYGEQECCNVMPSKKTQDWAVREIFLDYMSRIAQKRSVFVSGPGGEIRITKKHQGTEPFSD